jgi:PAS domain S-box-containing protein
VIKLFHLDDSDDDLILFKAKMKSAANDIQITRCESPQIAIDEIINGQFDCIVSDYDMPGKDGLQVLKELREAGIETPFIFLTGQGNEKLAVEAFRFGANDYFSKETSFARYDRIVNSIRNQVEHSNNLEIRSKLSQEVRALDYNWQQMMMNNTSAIAVHEIITDEDATDYRYSEVNDAFEEMFSLSREELIGKRLSATMSADHELDDLVLIYNSVAKTGKSKHFKIFSTAHNKWFEVTAYSPIDNYLVSIINDITEQKRAQQEILESQARYREIVEDLKEFVIRFTPDGKITFINKATKSIGHENGAKIIGTNLAEFEVPQDFGTFLAPLAQMKKCKSRQSCEAEVIYPDNRLGWISWVVKAISRDNKQIIEYQAIGLDISDEKSTEVKLQDSEKRYLQISENMTDMIMTTNTALEVEFINPACEQILGYKPEELIGNSSFMAVHPEDMQIVEEAVKSSMSTMSSKRERVRLIHKDGHTVWVESIGSPLCDDAGEFIGAQFVSRDISENVEAEEILLKQKYYLEKSQELGKIGTWEFDVATSKLTWTDQTCLMFGVPKGSVVDQQKFFDLVHPDDLERVGARWEEAMQGEPFDVDHRVVVDGEIRWMREKGEVYFNDKSEAVSAIGFAQDITDQKDAEESLRQSEDLYKVLFESDDNSDAKIDAKTFIVQDYKATIAALEEKAKELSNLRHIADSMGAPGTSLAEKILNSAERYKLLIENQNDLVVKVDVEGNFLYVSPSYCMTFGKSEEELLGGGFMPLVHKDDQEPTKKAMEGLFVPPYSVRIEQRAMTVDGWRWFEWEDTAVFDEKQNVTKIIGVGRDITSHKKAEAELLESENKYRSLTEHLPVGVYRTTTEDKIIFCNHALVKMLGYENEEELLQLTVSEVFASNETREKQLSEWMGSDEIHCDELQLLRKDGSKVYVRDTGQFVDGGPSGDSHFEGVIENITDRKLAEDNLSQAYAELEAANVELDSFSHTVAHDLKSPLQQILGYADLLSQHHSELLDEEGKEFLSKIISSSEKSTTLIKDILDFSRIISQKLTKEKVDLSREAKIICLELGQEFPDREVSIEIAQNVEVYGSASLLTIVLRNLIENSWKFTGNTDRAELEFGVSEDSGKQIYFVRDNGAGFDDAYADKLFAPFQRLHTDQEFQGTGVGLATVRRIIERHKGEVWAKSKLGEGATFFFTLTE